MGEDLFDVVNERDEVVQQALRSQVHENKWLHRAVHVLVFNGKGDLFLQRRAFTKDSHPGKWDSSCSGHVDAGEDYLMAAVRELKEELGVKVEISELELLEYISASVKTDQEFIKVFKVEHEGPFVLNEEEIIEGRFFVFNRIRDWMLENPEEFATAFKTILGLNLK